MDNRPIGVFDSGVGGLSVVKELIKILPCEDIVYFGDTGRVPYGTRSKETIQRYVRQDMDFLLGHDVKMVVAACGTASSVMTEEMIKALPVPYTGVILPAAQAACAASPQGHIGVIGTSATVRSGSFRRAVRSIRPDAQVVGSACPLFVPLVENGYIEEDNQVTRLVAQKYLEPIAREGVDTLILGCTHFPLLYNLINDLLEYKVTLVDSGRETARYVCNFLSESGMLTERTESGNRQYFVSDQTDGFTATAELFLGMPVRENATYVSLEDL